MILVYLRANIGYNHKMSASKKTTKPLKVASKPKSLAKKAAVPITVAPVPVKKLPVKRPTSQPSQKIKSVPVDTVSIPDVTKLEHVKNITSTVALATFKVPFDMDRMVINIARSSGVVFVMLGMVLTVFLAYQIDYFAQPNFTQNNLSTVFRATNQAANVYSVLESDIQFDLPTEGNLTGITPLIINVDGAESVELFGQFNNTRQLIFLGIAEQRDYSTWVLLWNTATIPDGEYNLVAVIEENNRVYSIKDAVTVLVDNIQAKATEELAQVNMQDDSTSATESDPESSLTNQEAVVISDSYRLVISNDVSNSAFVSDAILEYDISIKFYYLIAALSVVSLGLLLILIGLYLRPKNPAAEI